MSFCPQYPHSNGKRCHIHRPTTSELESTSFSNYIRNVVFAAARINNTNNDDDDTSDDDDNKTTNTNHHHDRCHDYLTKKKKIALKDGIAKICFPPDFFLACVPYGHDTSGRGPIWDDHATLNFALQSPIEQNIRGLAGVYEYTHRVVPHMMADDLKLAQFRTMADAYAKAQLPKNLYERTLGCNASTASTANNNDNTEWNSEDLAAIERRFWKRLTPTMPPPIYGADHEGTLFVNAVSGDDDTTNDVKQHHHQQHHHHHLDFAISHLDSCLNLLADKIPGVTTSYLYAGMFATVFCAHTEDMDLLSINYLHAGSPKLWYAIPEMHANRFRSLAEHYYANENHTCREFLRHKRALLSPVILQKAGIPYTTAVQYPGEAVVTFPGSYHFGFNVGFNVAEATNFAVPEWVPFGETARVCLCRPDSVRIHMGRMKELLQLYNYDTEPPLQQQHQTGETEKDDSCPNLSYRDWRRKFQDEAKQLIQVEEKPFAVDTTTTATPQSVLDTQQQQSSSSTTVSGPANPQESTATTTTMLVVPTTTATTVLSDATMPAKKQKRKTKTKTTTTKKRKQPLSDQQRKKEFWVELTGKPEDWRLAQPIIKTNKAKSLSVHRRILLFVSATDDYTLGNNNNDKTAASLLNGEEACVAGSVVEVADGHVRLHLDGQPRSNDIWIPMASAISKQRLFLDGGTYNPAAAEAAIPALHYWDEQDSSRRRQEQQQTTTTTTIVGQNNGNNNAAAT